MILFTFLHSCDKTIIFNAINMLLEIGSTIFPVISRDFHNPWCAKFDENEHTFGGWRSGRKAFYISKEVSIKETHRRYINFVFVGGLNIHHTNISDSGDTREHFLAKLKVYINLF